jgi:hypothetical protein
MQRVDVMWIAANVIDKQLWKVNTMIKNMLSFEKSIIANKCQLSFELMKRPQPNYLPDTMYLRDFHKIEHNEVYIVRPCGRGYHSGNGVFIVANDMELTKVKEIYTPTFIQKKQEYYAKQQQPFDVIISKYILNPLLHNGLKMHIRFYLMISLVNGFSWSLFKLGSIMTARDKYTPSDFANTFIHDTHIRSTPANLFYPHDIPATSETLHRMQQQIDDLCKLIAEIYRPYAKTYSESKTGFEIFALDTMFDADYNLYVLELNDLVGYNPANKSRDAKYTLFGRKFQRWAFKQAIQPAISKYVAN